MSLPRFLHRFYADLLGYFWLPCPICGRMFGGHETASRNIMWRSDGTGECVCPDCGEEARRRSDQRYVWL